MVETILVPTAYMNKAKFLSSTITKIAAFAALIIIAAAQFVLHQQQSLALEQQQQQQQQQPQQQNQIALSQVIKQIAQQVANANPGTNATQVYEILVQLAKQTAQTAGNEQAIENIRQIYSQVIISPSGILSQSLARFAQQIASGGDSTNGIEIIQQIIQ
jgi:hydrogenase maturation factor HypF (carbamoyltransferase family)